MGVFSYDITYTSHYYYTCCNTALVIVVVMNMKHYIGIALLVIAIVLLWSSNKQGSLPLPPPDDDEKEEVLDFETWFSRHHVECDTCEPGWPPRLCEEAWNKLEIMRASPQDLMMLHKGIKND